MGRRRLLIIGMSLVVNAFISWTLLPLVIPPFRIYTISELAETLLWQGMGAFGWPLALLGIGLSAPFGGHARDLGSVLMTLVYPGMLVLAVRVFTMHGRRLWPIVLLHLLLTLSFALVWWRVLNGYQFMEG
jgi:hypothetical protein